MRFSWRASVALAALWLSAVCLTQPAFSFVDDEVAQIVAAREPASSTVRRFWFGAGRHEHPRLSDLLLHFRPIPAHG